MIWLASFPRSGNTFFRNILHDVYGISSSSYHHQPGIEVDKSYMEYPVVKTHLLPSQLPEDLQGAKSVYLVRDGRDALVSIAHHRKDIIAPGSNYHRNLLEAIVAYNGSHFGGWGRNVKEWTEKADIVIRYEDLVKDPIGEVSKLSKIIDLPEPNIDNIPTFKKLKEGNAKYGSGARRINKDIPQEEFSNKFFRRGIVGSYKDEMPLAMRLLFWSKYRKQMKALNYY